MAMMTQALKPVSPLLRCPHCNARLYKVRDGDRVTIEDKDGNRHTFHARMVETYCQRCRHEFDIQLPI